VSAWEMLKSGVIYKVYKNLNKTQNPNYILKAIRVARKSFLESIANFPQKS
jgi:hypothetical protein